VMENIKNIIIGLVYFWLISLIVYLALSVPVFLIISLYKIIMWI